MNNLKLLFSWATSWVLFRNGDCIGAWLVSLTVCVIYSQGQDLCVICLTECPLTKMSARQVISSRFCTSWPTIIEMNINAMEGIIYLLGSNKQIAIPFTEITHFVFKKKSVMILDESPRKNIQKIMFLSSYVSFFVSYLKYKRKSSHSLKSIDDLIH